MKVDKHAACTEKMKNAYKILVGIPQGRDHLGDLCVMGAY
jgi:hypothetical protein